jgi:uncharacterized paraquat-inducible protein A
MSDLISREKLIKEAESLRVTIMGLRSGKGILAEYAKHYRESFLRMIDEQPSVEPVRGEWIDTQPEYHHGYGNNTKVCSNCHDYYTKEWEDLYFCPRCGADMRGEKND